MLILNVFNVFALSKCSIYSVTFNIFALSKCSIYSVTFNILPLLVA